MPIIKIKNKLLIVTNIAIIVGLYILCCVLIKRTNINVGFIADNSFLFNYLGILLGFALTIFTFIVSMVDKIRDGIEKDDLKTIEEKKKSQDTISAFYSEIRDNIYLIFLFFIVISFFTLFEKVDIPFITINKCLLLTKSQLINSAKLEIFVLSLYAIYDLCSSAFKISEITGIFKIK